MRWLDGERRRLVATPLLAASAVWALSACGGNPPVRPGAGGTTGATPAPAPAPAPVPAPARVSPSATGKERKAPVDVYAHDRPGMLSPVVAKFPERVYVPNSESNTVWVINPRTYRVIRRFPVDARPQHVVPSWDLKTLWVNNNDGNTLTPIDPVTGRPGRPVPVEDPYNLYFTPDGRTALVMAERNNQLDFRDPHTMRLRHSLSMPCRGINHGDFTADESVFLASCEFSGQLVAVDMRTRKVRTVVGLSSEKARRRLLPGSATRRSGLSRGHAHPHGHTRRAVLSPGHLRHDHTSHRAASHAAPSGGDVRHAVPAHGDMRHGMAQYDSMPQDVKLSPDGTTFYVADMATDGVWLINAANFRIKGFIKTGAGAHGLYVSRDSRLLYVSNRGAGSVSVVSFARRRPIDTWRIPGGGSPDMGGVSADGRRLWLSGRYHGVVYVFDTVRGRLIRKIEVGAGPHGLAVYPQPGRYSLGHTGIFR